MSSNNGQLNFEILLNPSVPQADELRLSRQVEEMYRLFVEAQKAGVPVANTELARIGLLYQSRLYELRRALIPLGWCIDLVGKTDGGVCFYQLVRVEESRFYAKHKDKL